MTLGTTTTLRRRDATKGRHLTGDALSKGFATGKEQSLLGGCLQLGTSGDLDRVAGGDLDGLAGLRVAARAGGAGGALDGEPSRDGDLDVVGDGVGERREERLEDLVDNSLGQA
jgi:hypothetical protein